MPISTLLKSIVTLIALSLLLSSAHFFITAPQPTPLEKIKMECVSDASIYRTTPDDQKYMSSCIDKASSVKAIETPLSIKAGAFFGIGWLLYITLSIWSHCRRLQKRANSE